MAAYGVRFVWNLREKTLFSTFRTPDRGFTRLRDAPYHDPIHLVLTLHQLAISVARPHAEYRQSSLSAEILFAHQERQLTLKAVTERRLVAATFGVPGENAHLVEIKWQ